MEIKNRINDSVMIKKNCFKNGLPYSVIKYQQAIDLLCRLASQWNRPTVVYTPNVHHFHLFSTDCMFRKAYMEADFSLLDGMPLVFLAKILNHDNVEKISGSDVFVDLFKMAVKKKLKVFLLGGETGVAEKAAVNIGAEQKLGKTIFVDCPEYGFEKSNKLNSEVLDKINQVEPDILFVGLGAPKQEVWIYSNVKHLKAGVILGVGGSFNFVAGTTKRAPLWLQKICLEWLYRLFCEPRRLWKRYLITNLFYIKHLITVLLSKK